MQILVSAFEHLLVIRNMLLRCSYSPTSHLLSHLNYLPTTNLQMDHMIHQSKYGRLILVYVFEH